MKYLITLVSICLLYSCTSEPLNVHYYLLHVPDKPANNNQHDSKYVVKVNQVKVADYLRQSTLVIQTAQHELHFSRQDVWAEALPTAISKSLLQDLTSNGDRGYVAAISPHSKHTETNITVEFEHFHITNTSTVVASGNYWVESKAKPNKTIGKPFYFDLELADNGYPHAVKQLRKLIEKLATKIHQDVAKLDTYQ